MSLPKGKNDLVNIILEDTEDKNLEEEELVHLLLQRKISKNVNSIQDENLTSGAKMADRIARFAGSWTFIITFAACLVLWILLNTFFLSKAFDAYPFILLNLLLSCIAAIQAPVIMMSQNRQEEKDRLRSLNAYKTNLKSEIIVEALHHKLDELLENQNKIFHMIEKLEQQSNHEA